MPKYVVVPEGKYDGIVVAGDVYRVVRDDGDYFACDASARSSHFSELFCRYKNCRHLQGGDWIIKEGEDNGPGETDQENNSSTAESSRAGQGRAKVTGCPTITPKGTTTNEAPKNSGIELGEIVAYRAWKISKDGLLHSIYLDKHVWMPGEVQVASHVTDYYGPGIHACKHERITHLKYIYGWTDVVVGRVLLFGDVIEFEQGYKATHAIPLAIDEWFGNEHGAELRWHPITNSSLARVYGLKQKYEFRGKTLDIEV